MRRESEDFQGVAAGAVGVGRPVDGQARRPGTFE